MAFLERREDHCARCPLYNAQIRNRHVPTEIVQLNDEGGIDVLFVAEAPGEEEDRVCRPLIGKSGQLIRKIIRTVGAAGIGYAFANTTRCRPTKLRDDKRGVENRQPTPEERAHCMPYTLEDIKKLRPKKIVALGGVSAGAFLPKFRAVAEIRGKLQEVTLANTRKKMHVLPTYHPAAALRDSGLTSYIIEDVARAFNKSQTINWKHRGKSRAITSVKDVKKLVHKILYQLTPEDDVAFDVETESLGRMHNRLLSIGFAWKNDVGYSIPFDHPDAPWAPDEFVEVRRQLRRLFTRKRPSFGNWLAHNSIFDLQQVHTALGVWVSNRPVIDTMWLFYGYDENRLELKQAIHPYALKQLLSEFLDWNPYSEKVLQKRAEGTLGTLGLEELLHYNAIDCYATVRLRQWIEKNAGNYWPKLKRLAVKLISPGHLMLAQMEKNGFAVDTELAQKLASSTSPLLQHLDDTKRWFRTFKSARRVNKRLIAASTAPKLNTLFGRVDTWQFDLRKREHLLELFITELKLKPLGFGKQEWKGQPGPKIDKAFMGAYKDVEAVAKLKSFREIDKLMSSYVKSILALLRNNPECSDGRIRPSFFTTRTVTGRPACANPNLQQIPRKSDEKDGLKAKTMIKNMFSVEPGNVLISADVMQGEVYLLGQVAKDHKFAELLWRIRELMDECEKNPNEDLIKRIETEGDVHRQTASLMFNVPVANVTKEQRQMAKSIVFGLIYGQHYTTLARNLKITDQEALDKSRQFFRKFKASEAWLKRAEEEALKNHEVMSELGRKRRFPRMFSGDDKEINRATRQARNSPIQSLLSDIVLYTASRLQRIVWKHKLPWRLVDLVHDAVIAEVPYADIERYIKVARKVMTDLKPIERDFDMKFIVPINVEFEVGISYGNLEKVGFGEASLRKVRQFVSEQWAKRGYHFPKPKLSMRAAA